MGPWTAAAVITPKTSSPFRALRPRFFSYDSLRFLNSEKLVRHNIAKFLLRSARPFDFERGNHRVRTQSERQRQITLRAIARTAAHHAPLLARAALDPHHRPDPIAVGFAPYRPHVDP